MRPRDSLVVRALVAGAAAIVALGLLLVPTWLSSREADLSTKFARRASDVVARSNEAERRVIDLETGVRGYALTGDPHFLEPWRQARAALPGELFSLRELVADPAQRRELAALERGIDSYVSDYTLPIVRRGTVAPRRVARTEAAEGKRRVDSLREGFARFRGREQLRVRDRRADANRGSARARTAALIGLGGAVLLVLALVAYVIRSIVLPVRRLIPAAARIAGGDRAVRVRERGRGEVGALSAAFNQMAGALGAERARVDRALAALHESEAVHRLIVSNLPDAVVSLWDRELRCSFVEGPALARHGRSPADFEGRLLGETLSPRRYAQAKHHYLAALGGERRSFDYTSNRGEHSFRVDLVPYRDDSGAIVGALSVARDVTERTRAEQALRDAEERFRGAFAEAPIGMALFDPEARVLDANAALAEITGREPGSLSGMTLADICHPEELPDARRAFDALIGGRRKRIQTEARGLHATGQSVWVSLSATVVRDGAGEPLYVLAQVQDVTDRRRYEDQLQHLADHDPLTGLLNRRRFEQELERQVDHVRRYGATGAAIVLDLDHFKYVNDTLGHNTGDEIIVNVARILTERLRSSDVVSRLGGDEFAILLPRAGEEEAAAVAQSLVERIREGVNLMSGGVARRVTTSVGIALFEDDPDQTGEDVMVNADLAMYEAKEAGRDGYAFYSTSERREARIKERMTWMDRIRTALDEDGFELHAQPILDLTSGEVTRHELLLRMRAPDGELIGPAAFLYIAERFDLVQELDRWVVRQAIGLISSHAEAGSDLCLEVNVSGKSIGDPELVEAIRGALAASSADPRNLVLEVTETAAIANIPRARAFAEDLSRLGCRFALDDFGAGFGSFYYLKHLPFDYLKIDGEFVSGCRSNRTDQLVIEAVVRIARGLGKKTIAEFVGDPETQEHLRASGIDFAQGYHVGRPVPVERALALPATATTAAATR